MYRGTWTRDESNVEFHKTIWSVIFLKILYGLFLARPIYSFGLSEKNLQEK